MHNHTIKLSECYVSNAQGTMRTTKICLLARTGSGQISAHFGMNKQKQLNRGLLKTWQSKRNITLKTQKKNVCMCVFSHIQLFATLWTVGYSVYAISQARILGWVAISSSRGSSQPRDQTRISCIGRWIFLPLSLQGGPQENANCEMIYHRNQQKIISMRLQEDVTST